jgi:hypothetical protein
MSSYVLIMIYHLSALGCLDLPGEEGAISFSTKQVKSRAQFVCIGLASLVLGGKALLHLLYDLIDAET